MFESAVVRQTGTRFDIGILAETILFYRQVIVPANTGSIAVMIKNIGHDNLLGLIDDGHLMLDIIEDNIGVYTKTNKLRTAEFHDFASFELAATPEKQRLTKEDVLLLAIRNVIASKSTARKVAKKILDKSTKYKINTLSGPENRVTDLARKDALNEDFMKLAVPVVVNYYAPEYVKENSINFKVVEYENYLVALHNINFDIINKRNARLAPHRDLNLTSAKLLSHISAIREELALSAHYLSELVTSPLNHNLLQIQFEYMLRKRNVNHHEYSIFQETVLEGHSIRDAINSGERSFSEFRDLLNSAGKFKNWMGGLKPDAKLIAEYCKANTAGTWADKLPIKTFRFAVCFLAGIINISAGLVASGIDTFLLDKILKGWAPHHFVQAELKDFVNDSH